MASNCDSTKIYGNGSETEGVEKFANGARVVLPRISGSRLEESSLLCNFMETGVVGEWRREEDVNLQDFLRSARQRASRKVDNDVSGASRGNYPRL
jgi:hypothetical protein